MGLPIAGFKASCLHCFITRNMKHEFLLIIMPQVKISVKQNFQWYKLVAKPTPILAQTKKSLCLFLDALGIQPKELDFGPKIIYIE